MTDWEARKAKILARLARAEGQVRAVMGMVRREAECEETAQQLAAARRALDRAFYEMVACMTQRELEQAGVKSRDAMDRVDHVTGVLARYG